MQLIRRVSAILAMAVIGAIGVRLGGKGGTPRQHGGWTPIDLNEARDRVRRGDERRTTRSAATTDANRSTPAADSTDQRQVVSAAAAG